VSDSVIDLVQWTCRWYQQFQGAGEQTKRFPIQTEIR